MKLFKKCLHWIGLSTCLAASTSASAESWIRAESDHFVIYSNVSEAKTTTYVKKLEAFRTLTNMLLDSVGTAAEAKFQIYLLGDADQMQVVRPNFSKYVGGVYFHCGEGSVAYSLAPVSAGDPENNLVTLFHEYAHHVMFQHARSYYPAWFVEGFAEYLSTADARNNRITVGESSPRIYTLRKERWIGFDKVLNPQSRMNGGDKDANDWDVESFYAQSWLLAHYMLSDPARSKALHAYFSALGDGADPIVSWETITGIKIDTLHRVLNRYRENMYYVNVPVPDYAGSAIRIARLDEGTDRYILKGSLLMTCPSADLGKATLDSLVEQKPKLAGNRDYRLALARAQVLYGDLAEAEADLQQLLAADPNDFQTNYLLGRIRMAQAEKKEGTAKSDLTDQARAFFMTAFRANRLDAPNLYYLARSFGNKPNFPDTNALNAADGAHRLAPSVMEYAVFDAFANLYNKKPEKAAAVLTPLGSNPHNQDQAMRARKAIEAIKAGKAADEVMKLLTSRP
jgi:tetratricopeptide (TPR) repeat protein